MAAKVERYNAWSVHVLGGAALCLVAAAAPVIYCMWFGELAAAGEAGLGACLGAHPLPFSEAIFVAGVMGMAIGVVLRIQAQHEEAELERTRRRRERAVQRAGRETARTPRLDKNTLKGMQRVIPDEIEVDEELELGLQSQVSEASDGGHEDSDSVMAYLQQEQDARALRRQQKADTDGDDQPGRTPSQYYVPPGLEEAPVLYLEADVDSVSAEDPAQRIDNPNLPYDDVNEALRHAFRIVMNRGTPVLVRAKPGVYQAAVEIPDRVTLINHRMPASATVDQRFEWLCKQDDISHPERVTFLAPSDSEFGVRVMPGRKQGLFGCYIVGRRGVAQTGLRSKENVALAVVHCAFEACSRSGAQVVNSGEDYDGRRVQFVGCRWRLNSAARRGGGLAVRNSAVRIEASIFEGNTAPRGGALSVVDAAAPLVLERSMLQRNRAVAEDAPKAAHAIKLGKWKSTHGIGGAMLVEGGLARVSDCVFEGNDAAVGGGAIASMAGRVVVKSTDEDRGICRGNRAGAGGALLAAGWPEKPGMIRLKGVLVTQNLAKSVGGGSAAVGNAVLHFEGATVQTNRTEGGKSGVGGGIAAWCGAAVKIDGGEVSSNLSSGGGGGVAVLNGSLKLSARCAIKRNRSTADTGGGGVLVVTKGDRDLERYIGQQGFSLPFKVKLERVRITLNNADGPGGGVRIGNLVNESTFPLAVTVEAPDWIKGNETRAPESLCEDIWVHWAGELRANDDTPTTLKMALK